MLRSAALLLAILPAPAFAVGSETTEPTETTVQCPEGTVYDAEREGCVKLQDSRMDDGARIEAARELAEFGRADEALDVLAALKDPATAEALTVRGFATRKAGDWDAGVALYRAALELDPDHWQARSYLGLGLLERGDRASADEQLQLIRAAGGRGTYPEAALSEALATGRSGY